MFDFVKFLRLLRSFYNAMKARDWSLIIEYAKQLAEHAGFAAEAKELVELIASAQAGDWQGVLTNAGEFAIVLAIRFGVPPSFVTMMASADADAQFEAMLAHYESESESVITTTEEQKNIVPVVLLLLQLFRLIREWRGR